MRRLLFAWDDFECAPRCFAHNQRKDYFIFRNTGASADAPVFHFHRWSRNEKRQLQHRFLRKRGAAGLPPQAHYVRQIPPFVAARHLPPERGKSALKGTPYGNVGNFPAATEAVPLGKVASPQAMTEGVLPGKQVFLFSRKLYRHEKKLPLSGELASRSDD